MSAATTTAGMTTYRLPLAAEPVGAADDVRTRVAEMDAALLHENAVWFCRLRWCVVAALGGVAVLALFPQAVDRLGLTLEPTWPMVLAAVSAVVNAGCLALLPRSADPGARGRIHAHLWVQILVDLAVLSAVIHFLGSVATHAPFMYLFHIVLACIFFSAAESLGVTAVSAVCYVTVVFLERSALLAPSTVLLDAAPAAPALPAAALLWRLLSVLLIWGVIWYLVSRLAAALRRRQRELAATNVRLALGSRERMRHMLQTTHQLKAPFAAIHANTQLLLGGYCGELADAARRVVVKIADRSTALSQQIVQILQLANLRSDVQSPPPAVDLDLAELIAEVVERQAPAAAARDVRIAADLNAAPLRTCEDHARMLIENVLSNAIAYSRPGGTVEVLCAPRSGGGAEVAVRDHGIGIEPEKLPAVFDEYFRTKEAVRHNRSSTGLGLAVVRRAARMTGVAVEMASAPGSGTCVALAFPAVSPTSPESN